MTSLVLAILIQAVPAAQPKDFAEAYKRSEASGRPLLILVGADWCPSCRVMKDSVLPKLAKGDALSKLEYAYVDKDRQPELCRHLLRGRSLPQLIYCQKTASGWKSLHLLGKQTAKGVTRFIARSQNAFVVRLTKRAKKSTARKPKAKTQQR